MISAWASPFKVIIGANYTKIDYDRKDMYT